MGIGVTQVKVRVKIRVRFSKNHLGMEIEQFYQATILASRQS